MADLYCVHKFVYQTLKQIKMTDLQTLETTSFLTIDKHQLSVEKFLATKPVSIQRLEEPRHKKLKKILTEKTLPTHLEVGLVQTHFTDEYYEDGKYYSVNGNTRKYIWNLYPETRPTQNLYVTVYHAFNKEEVNEIYRSIDSGESVETARQMIGGLCRDNHFIPQSKYVSSGKFSTALRHAYSCVMGDRSLINYTKTSFTEIKNKKEFEFFDKEIKFLDVFYKSFENNVEIKNKMNFGSMFSALLIVSKKYGVDNPKITEMINKLINNVITKHEGYDGENDGVSVIIIELYDKFGKQTDKWSDISAGFGPIIIGNLLYCMEAYMNDCYVKIKNTKSNAIIMKDSKIIDYFVDYFKSDN